MRRNFSILVTQRCNESCTYCDFPSIESPRTIDERGLDWAGVLAYELLPKGSNVSIVGGEPGCVPADKIKRVLEIFTDPWNGHNVEVATNGLFIDAFIEGEMPEPHSILLHHTHPMSFRRKPWGWYDKERLKHTFVVKSTHPDEVKMWADESRAAGVQSQVKLAHDRKGEGKPGYEAVELEMLADICDEHPGIDDRSATDLRALAELKRSGKHHEHIIKCAQAAPAPLIDLVTGMMHRCSRSYTTFDTRKTTMFGINDPWPLDEAKLRTCVTCSRCFNV